MATMKKRYQAALLQQSNSIDGSIALPLDASVAAYYRQSTNAQVGNISTEIQTVDLLNWLKGRGWAEDKIVLIDTDEGVSGQLKINERKGMRYMYELIITGKIKAVACQDEDRLFRDQTQIEVNIFIETCKKHRVLVITPNIVYDFAHPLLGPFHIKQFRYKCEMAADYISTVIVGKLHLARQKVMSEGRWAGAKFPAGYMVDVRKTLPNGERNPDWRKFVPYQPHADVIVAYYKLFLQNGCNLRRTIQEITKHGPWFPASPKLEGFRFPESVAVYQRRHTISRTGLTSILTNAAYLGHWAYKGVITKWNHHAPIVPVDLFMRVFNRLSGTTLEGQENKNYEPVRQVARPTLEEQRTEEYPMCGMFLRNAGDDPGFISTYWHSHLSYYIYGCTLTQHQDGKEITVWNRRSSVLDAVVSKVVQDKLTSSFNESEWRRSIDRATKQFTTDERLLASQVEALEATMSNLVQSLSVLKSAEMIAAIESQYQQVLAKRNDVFQALQRLRDESSYLDALNRLRDEYRPSVENWGHYSNQQKQTVMQAFVDFIEVQSFGRASSRLTIFWKDGTKDSVPLRYSHQRGEGWLPEERKLLAQLIRDGASQIEIARQFPTRTWRAIVMSARIATGNYLRARPRQIKLSETYEDYQARTKSVDLKTSDSCSR
jgi:DNA invertase Pin-like site-specific DNA recombinase